MVFTTYTNDGAPSTAPGRNRQKRLTGTAHAGPQWVNAIRTLRLVTQNAVAQADPQRWATPTASARMLSTRSVS